MSRCLCFKGRFMGYNLSACHREDVNVGRMLMSTPPPDCDRRSQAKPLYAHRQVAAVHHQKAARGQRGLRSCTPNTPNLSFFPSSF